MRNFVLLGYKGMGQHELIAEGTLYSNGVCVFTRLVGGEEYPVEVFNSLSGLESDLPRGTDLIWANQDLKDTCPTCGKLYAWVFEGRFHSVRERRNRGEEQIDNTIVQEVLQTAPWLCRGLCDLPAEQEEILV